MKAAVIVASTSGYKGEKEDKSGPAVARMLKQVGFEVKFLKVLPDDRVILAEVMKKLADRGLADLIVTAGGIGVAKDDCTPDASLDIIEKEIRGIPEAMRAYSMRFTKRAMLSRAVAGIRGNTMIVNLPGSPKEAKECLEFVLPELVCGVEKLKEEI